MSDRSAPSPTTARILLATAVLTVVAGLTLAPRAVAWPARTLVLDALEHLPPRWNDLLLGGNADTALNIAFFVPLGAALALLLPLRWSPASVLVAAAVSLTVEVAQTVLPGRVSDPGDVVANTAGALVGTVVVVFARVMFRGDPGSAQRGSRRRA